MPEGSRPYWVLAAIELARCDSTEHPMDKYGNSGLLTPWRKATFTGLTKGNLLGNDSQASTLNLKSAWFSKERPRSQSQDLV